MQGVIAAAITWLIVLISLGLFVFIAFFAMSFWDDGPGKSIMDKWKEKFDWYLFEKELKKQEKRRD